jgi:ABC-type Fe3+ transport system substrate-binding protein
MTTHCFNFSIPKFLGSFGMYTYDNTKLSASQIPSSFADLTDPFWKNKLVLTYPNDDDAVCALFANIVSRHGFSWLEGLAANNVTWVRGTATPGYKIVEAHHQTNSSLALSFSTYAEVSETWLSTALPTAEGEHIMAWAQSGAIFASTPRPEAAKLFLAWLVSESRQNSTLAGVDGPSLRGTGGSVLMSLNKKLGVDVYGSDLAQITGFPLFEQDRYQVEWWKNMFEDVLGTAHGVNPLEVYPNTPYSG